ncbi:MAG: type II toxin-antitoxin system RelE/ParE family toxin [Deltaproteobacteria bacterium]|nr:type II toxin-antitoxin system RelE/ParE family toxin [Deltaproteobacteria bacterium]
MVSFKIEWKGSSERDIRNIDRQYVHRIINVIESLSENPFPVQFKKLRDSELTYRIRVGDYRVIYQVDLQKKVVTIYHIRHRKDAYRK